METQSSQLAFSVPDSAPALRLLVDGRKLGDGGIGVYIENLVLGVLAAGGCEVTVIASHEQASRASFTSDVRWIFDSTKPYSVDELLFFSRRIPFARFDLFHTPHYVLPYGIPIPTVVTVHDLIHIKHPERFFYPTIARALMTSAVARADAVIAVSRDTAQQLISAIGADPKKLFYVPNAISPSLGLGAQSDNAPRIDCSSPYFLSVLSNLKPHKGLEDVLQAWQSFGIAREVADVGAPKPELVLVGYGAQSILSNRALQSRIEGINGIRVLGAVDSSTLRHLYRSAQAIVIPSLSEGFCLPALEAQACGTPVVCRPVPAIKELVTANDVVASDFSIDALAEAMLAGLHKKRVVVPLSHFKSFSVEVVGKQVCDVYAKVAREESRA